MSLRIELLGPMKVSFEGHSLDLPPRSMVPDLMAYLLLEADHTVGRDTAAARLWSDINEEEGRARLRRHLYRLKDWLPPTVENAEWVLADRSTIRWNPQSRAWVDVWEFEALSSDPKQAEQALEFYRGDLLQHTFDDWVIRHRERLRNLYLADLLQAVNNQEQNGDFLRAIEFAQRLLREEPLREDIYRELMRLHAKNGDRAGIVRYFNLCVSVLRHELDIGPSHETEQAYRDLLEQAAPTTTKPVSADKLEQQHNLPSPLTSFVGRRVEQNRIVGMLDEHRLVTLTGLGGVGKSRLAMHIGERLVSGYSDGVWWIDLSNLQEAPQLPQVVASALGLRSAGEQAFEESLIRSLEPRHALLIIDSCEHQTDAVADLIRRLLEGAPEISVLATSTEPLGIVGERLVRLLPLGVPPEVRENFSRQEITELKSTHASLSLFEARAAANMPTFRLTPGNLPAAVHICRALDGLPLALELAAARLRVLSINQLAERLDDRFRVLADGPRTMPSRHQTLRATLDWSYESLSTQEQLLFRRMAVFSGGSSLEFVEGICSGDGLEKDSILGLVSDLVDKSLLQVKAGQAGGTRYQMLETVHAYASEKQAHAGEAARLEGRHSEAYFQLVLEASSRLLRGGDDEAWFTRLDDDYSNLRAALRRAAGQQDFSAVGLVAGSLWPYWWTRGLVEEGWRWIKLALERREDLEAESLAASLHGAGRIRLLQGAYEEAEIYLEESLAAIGQAEQSSRKAEGLISLGISANRLGDHDRAVALWQQALRVYQNLNDQWGVARALNNLGDLALYQERHQEAVDLLERSRHAFKASESAFGESVCLINLGRARLLLDDLQKAADDFLASLRLKMLLKDKEGIAWTLEGMAAVAARRHMAEVAATLFGAAHHLRLEIGVPIAEADLPFYQDQLEFAKGQIKPEEWAIKWHEGEALGLKRAVELARSLS